MRPSLALMSLTGVISLACGDSVTEPPLPEAAPAPLYYLKDPTNSGDGQSDTVLATLASPFRVLVRRGDTPAPGVTVLWEMPRDTLRGIPGLATTTVTDAEGVASYTLTLGRAAYYTYAVRASVPGVTTPSPIVVARGLPCGSALCFTATAKPGKPTNLRIVSGDNQADTTNAQLGADYTVQATDRHGNGVPGAVIDWAVTAGGGSITPTQSTTAPPGGYAVARHTLGPAAGTHSATATASGLPGAPQVTFTATAFALGSLQVTATTRGVDPDENGYGVWLDGATRDTVIVVGANATVTISRLIPGDYHVTLRGVAMNCDFDPGTPNLRTITVPSGGTAALAFDVACAPVPLIAFTSWVEADRNPDIYSIQANGAAATNLTTNPAWDYAPAWSPDGTRIAFTSDRDGQENVDIYVMNADGSNPVRLTNEPALGIDPALHPAGFSTLAWSPDGTKIAFSRWRQGIQYIGDISDIHVMNADGTDIVNLTNNPAGVLSTDPAWSPDGTKIAFEQGGSIVVMNADGSGLTAVTPGGEPAWSPDGTKLAVTRNTNCYFNNCPWHGVFVVNVDGSGEAWLPGNGDDINPAWSPDGRWIAVASAPCFEVGYEIQCSGEFVITVLKVDWMDGVYEALSPGVAGLQPAWRP